MEACFHEARMAKHTFGRGARINEYGQGGKDLYYVLQVAPGMEDQTERLIKGQVRKGIYGRCFHPLRRVKKKFGGEWRDFHEKLLPGYVFITSDAVKELYQELRRVPKLTKLLGKEEELFVSLCEKDVEWLERLMGTACENRKTVRNENGEESGADADEEDGLLQTVPVGLSQVAVGQDTVTILSGPLKDMKGTIRKIHLHRRIAEVEVDFMSRKTVIYLGIEIVGKKGESAQ